MKVERTTRQASRVCLTQRLVRPGSCSIPCLRSSRDVAGSHLFQAGGSHLNGLIDYFPPVSYLVLLLSIAF